MDAFLSMEKTFSDSNRVSDGVHEIWLSKYVNEVDLDDTSYVEVRRAGYRGRLGWFDI